MDIRPARGTPSTPAPQRTNRPEPPNAVQPEADVIMPQLVDEDSDRIERAALIVERQLRLFRL